MPDHIDLLLRGGTLVLPWGEEVGDAGVCAMAALPPWACRAM